MNVNYILDIACLLVYLCRVPCQGPLGTQSSRWTWQHTPCRSRNRISWVVSPEWAATSSHTAASSCQPSCRNARSNKRSTHPKARLQYYKEGFIVVWTCISGSPKLVDLPLYWGVFLYISRGICRFVLKIIRMFALQKNLCSAWKLAEIVIFVKKSRVLFWWAWD